ncbi:MAG: peptidoglycan DD-metalloendopeptidase family protein, partial [Bifidobacteriaceae bacterium]|nr:peptidoglycan DD-metalloendopeptidase family protein [Bifidobacteriaceae bacterium]
MSDARVAPQPLTRRQLREQRDQAARTASYATPPTRLDPAMGFPHAAGTHSQAPQPQPHSFHSPAAPPVPHTRVTALATAGHNIRQAASAAPAAHPAAAPATARPGPHVATRPAAQPAFPPHRPTAAQTATAAAGASRPHRPLPTAATSQQLAAQRQAVAPAEAKVVADAHRQSEVLETVKAVKPVSFSSLVGTLRRHTKPLAAAIALALAGGAAAIGLSAAGSPATAITTEGALTPLRDTIEMVSRRHVMELSARSMTARLQPAVAVDNLNSTQVSNVALILNWEPPALEDGATLMVRRMVGESPPETPAEGVEVPLGNDISQVVDQGLQPDTTYAYTVFLQRPDSRPEVVGRLVTSTNVYPTQLTPGESLEYGERLVSPSNAYYITVSSDGEVLLYNNRNQKVWTLKAPSQPGDQLVLQSDGDLAVYANGEPLWSAGSTAAGAVLVLADSGDLQVKVGEAVIWTSADKGTVLGGSDSPYTVASTGWTSPGAGPIRSPFGFRTHPISGTWKLHEGVDLAAGGRGGPIYAAADGVVTEVRCDSGGNWTLVIDHGDGIET